MLRSGGRFSFGASAKGDAAFAGDLWRIEENEFLHEAGCERCAVHPRACFEEHAEDFAAAEFRKHRRKIYAVMPRFGADHFDACLLQIACFRGTQWKNSEYEQIVVRRFHDARFRRQAQLGIEDHAQKTLAARKTAAVGKERIIGENCADSCEKRVRSVAHAMHFRAGFFR